MANETQRTIDPNDPRPIGGGPRPTPGPGIKHEGISPEDFIKTVGLTAGALVLSLSLTLTAARENPEAPSWGGPGSTEQPAPQPQDLPPQGE